MAREELELMLAHPDMFGRRIPLLVFANKSDAPHALAPMQVASGVYKSYLVDYCEIFFCLVAWDSMR